VGLDDATCAAGIGCLLSSYRKNDDRKKLFYVPVKFIFPNDEQALAVAADRTTVRVQTHYF
jgi:hypothetical protein